ncbi:MAG: hypothetical protein M1269_09515 [Chloroflexi bacterium]|nr:hypothetical protein [Chloroflexota bacterium]
MKKKSGDFYILKSIIAVVVLFIIIINLNPVLDKEKMKFYPEEAVSTPTQMFLAMLGELRYTLAAVLWMKVDHYHHEVEAHEPGTTSPSVLQMTRMVTLLDPHFEQAYSVAAYNLAVKLRKKDDALQYLEEGIRNNPKTALLYWDKGFIYFHYREFAKAIPPMEIALRKITGEIDRANTARIIAHCYIKLGNEKMSEFYLKKVLEIHPGDYWASMKIKELENGTLFPAKSPKTAPKKNAGR